MRRAVLLVLMLIGNTALHAQCPDFSTAGPYTYIYRTVTIIPDSGSNISGTEIYYAVINDTIPSAARPCPIVVFGHGFQLGINMYRSYMQHLASWGYVAVLPPFPNPTNPSNPQHNLFCHYLIASARWTSALDTIPGDIFQGKLDQWNWAFAGHSLGGTLSLLTADIGGLADTLRVVVSFASPASNPATNPTDLTLPKLILTGSPVKSSPSTIQRSGRPKSTDSKGSGRAIHCTPSTPACSSR